VCLFTDLLLLGGTKGRLLPTPLLFQSMCCHLFSGCACVLATFFEHPNAHIIYVGYSPTPLVLIYLRIVTQIDSEFKMAWGHIATPSCTDTLFIENARIVCSCDSGPIPFLLICF
jgi:hypothetical protein